MRACSRLGRVVCLAACQWRRGTCSGASLLEVLVALLVISLGMLGAAKLATLSLGHDKMAQIRLTGSALAGDYADRARLNVYGFDLGLYALAAGAAVDNSALDLDAMDMNEADDAKAAAAVAAFDRSNFLRTVAATLPQGQAVVNTDAASGRAMDIWLIWQEPQAAPAGATDAQGLVQAAGQRHCPDSLAPEQLATVSCLYLRVQL